MIILNACNTVKISLDDTVDDTDKFSFFCITPSPPKDFEMHLLDGVIVDERTAYFLRDFPLEWIKTEDQIMGVRVEAPDEVCRDFLKSYIIDTEVLLDD